MNPRPTALITPAELPDRLTGDTTPTLVDVRTPAEYETAHIPGSINIPLPVVTEHATALAAGRLATRLDTGRLRRWFAYLVFVVAAGILVQITAGLLA